MDKQKELFEQAIAAEESGHLVLASDLLQKCVTLDETFSQGWLFYASVLMKLKQWDEAIQAAEHVLGDRSKNRLAIALSTIGQCHKGQESWDKAEAAFRKSLSVKERVTTWVFLGFTLSELGRDDEAIESYKAALKIEPEYDEAHYNLGCRYRLRGDYETAIAHFRRAIAADPKYAIAYAELGFALAQPGVDKNTLAEARRVLEKSVDLDPDYGWSRIYLANILWRLGENQLAQEQFGASIRIWPDSEFAHLCFAQFLSATTDDRVRIKRHFQMAIKCDPNYAGALYHFGGTLLNWNRRKDGERYLRRAAKLGHKQAMKLLEGLGPYVTKHERWPSCPVCGAPWKQTGSWWCAECGKDMRSKNKKRRGAAF
jgi:tetratricopeptide (TPR) repeat protein